MQTSDRSTGSGGWEFEARRPGILALKSRCKMPVLRHRMVRYGTKLASRVAMKSVVYLNPSAGSGRAERLWIQAAESELGRHVEAVRAPDVSTAESVLDAIVAQRPERLIAVGGDGTANLVASRILAADAGPDIVFGLVPAGTGSDLASALDIPKSPGEALRCALECEPRPIDAIEIVRSSDTRRFAINIASIGISGAVDQAANQIDRRTRMTYLRATIRALIGYRPQPWRLTLDGKPFFEGTFFVAAFANGRSFGGGMCVAPDALFDDGLADVVVVPPVPITTLPWRLPQFLAGRHIDLPFVRVARGRVLDAKPCSEGPHPPFDLDGETLDASAARLRLIPSALKIAVSREIR